MSFCSMLKKEEECPRPVAVGAGCWGTGAPGGKAWEVRVQGDDLSLVHSLHCDIFKMGSVTFSPPKQRKIFMLQAQWLSC